LEACQHHAQGQGFGVVPKERIFIDDGYSGATLDRPEMKRLREMVSKGKVSCVIVLAIDRLSRNIVDAVQLVLREWENVCHLKCVRQPIDTTTDLGRMIFGILAMFADFERGQIKARTFSGKVKRAAQGRNPGGRLPYGYAKGETAGSIIIDEEKAAVVRRIYNLYASGNGDRAIAAIFNAEGLPSYKGGTWARSSVARLLTIERYVGRWTYGETKKNERHRLGEGPQRVASDKLLADAKRPDLAIISPELWEKCQRIRAETGEALKKTSGRALVSDHLLSGLVKCRCGLSMRVQPDRHAFYYRCSGRKDKGKAFCDCGAIQEALIDEAVMHYVNRLNQDRIAGMVREHAEGVQKRRLQEVESGLSSIASRLKELDGELTRVRADYRSGGIDAATFNELRRDMDGERASLLDKQTALAVQVELLREEMSNRNATIDRIEQLSAWDSFTLQQQKQLLRGIINQITVYRKTGSNDGFSLEIDMNLPQAIIDAMSETATA
jgi:site-specific DNA recombinase